VAAPKADMTDASSGMSTLRRPSSLASGALARAPQPPMLMRENPRGSEPRSVNRARRARTMVAFATCQIPHAVSVAPNPS
jgi:hypothetical protein